MPKCVIKFKDGSYCNLIADALITTDEYIQAWHGDNRLVGIFLISEIRVAYLSEKAPLQSEKEII